jgi:CheY-like chemotaxis protein/anti-sigma regulatory factor (Ser/Thr protein kinase)
MLRQGVLDEPRRTQAIEVIERNAEMQARLIEDLLDISRIMVGHLRLRIEPVNLQAIIDAALDSVRLAAENKGLRVTSAVRVRSVVHGDAARLQQVVWNLLTNAIKFTPAHGAISIEAIEDDTTVRIVVTDSGEGIPLAFQSRLFEAFSQADASFARPHGGLGLGLALVKRMVEAHGGQVTAESRGPGLGATFTVTLPLGVGGPPDALGPARGDVGDIRGCRILLVEDDVDSAELARTILERAGASVVVCTRAREALSKSEGEDFEVLVADIGMPGEDGFWLIDQIRRSAQLKHRSLPAVALTAFASARHRERALAAGYHEHVPKPVDVDVLIDAIARLRGSRSPA